MTGTIAGALAILGIGALCALVVVYSACVVSGRISRGRGE